jgi:hypothetical protein
VNSRHRLPARAAWYRARGKVRLGDRRTYLGPAKGAGQDVIRGETCQGFTTEEGFEPLPRYFAAGLEFGSSDGQGDGAPQRFRSGFHFAGIQRPHAGQLAVFEGVGSAGGLIEEFAGTVPELSDDLHGLPIDVEGEHESTVEGGANRGRVDVVVVGYLAEVVKGVGEVCFELGQALGCGLSFRGARALGVQGGPRPY